MIYLDSCLLIYLVEPHPVFSPVLLEAIAAVGVEPLAISSLVRLECLAGPIRRADGALQRRYESFLAQFRRLGLPDGIYGDAAVLRTRFGLRTPDALHLACAQHHGCSALWTNDDRLARAGHGIARNLAP